MSEDGALAIQASNGLILEPCYFHQNMVAGELVRIGMANLCAENAKEAVERSSRGDFEPISYAFRKIAANALKVPEFFTVAQHRDCPLCELILSCECGDPLGCGYNKWIRLACNAVKSEAVAMGLLPTAENVH